MSGETPAATCKVRQNREPHCHTVYWADCDGCGWSGDSRPDHTSARADGLDHLAAIHGVGLGTLRTATRTA